MTSTNARGSPENTQKAQLINDMEVNEGERTMQSEQQFIRKNNILIHFDIQSILKERYAKINGNVQAFI